MILKQKRLEKGLTQQELMQLSGVPQSIISDIENETTRNPRVETMRRLAAALNCTVDELLFASDHTPTRGETRKGG